MKLLGDGRFCLDTGRRRLLEGGRPVSLRPRTYDVLAYLVENQRRVISVDEFVREVWQKAEVQYSSVMNQINQLRTALHDDAAQPEFIETKFRHGYLWIAAVREVDELVDTVPEPVDTVPEPVDTVPETVDTAPRLGDTV